VTRGAAWALVLAVLVLSAAILLHGGLYHVMGSGSGGPGVGYKVNKWTGSAWFLHPTGTWPLPEFSQPQVERP